MWNHYGLNGFGLSIPSGYTRPQFFGGSNVAESALFIRKSMPDHVAPATNTNYWVGKQVSRLKTASQTVFAQDHCEITFEGNDDIFWAWKQHIGPPDRAFQVLRHNKASNAVYVDGHVGRLDRYDQMDYRIYTGRPADTLMPPSTPWP
jgi:prepilin-type processing-associated H-X9-DG protein